MLLSGKRALVTGASRGIGAAIAKKLAREGADMNPAAGDFGAITKPMIPSGQYGTGDDIANAVTFIASSEAAYINGASLTVDGGLTA